MDQNLIAQMTSATRFVQARIGETLLIGNALYPCTEGETFTADMDFEQGGAVEIEKGSVIINKNDLPSELERGTTVSFRGDNYRVTAVDDLVANWDIKLVQLQA